MCHGCPTRWQSWYVDGLTSGSLRFFCCLKFLFSRSASWSVPLSLSAASPLFPAVVAISPAVGPLFYSLSTPSSARLCFTAGPLRLFVTFHVTRRCLFEFAEIFDELFDHPRADPRVLLVVRWLRLQPSRVARGPLAASPACTPSSTARCAWSRCFLRSCGFVT